MTRLLADRLVRPLWQAALGADGAGLSDGELLDCFLVRREEAAFAALVRRHGPMVFGVCRRVLRNHADVEDAFQATFLVLVRKGGTVFPRERVGDWLHGVAYRTALEARRAAARRFAKEQRAARAEERLDEPASDWSALLDQELCLLPAKYRSAVILCDLQGKTRQEAARQLGWPEGTVAGRLARARGLLASRLTRRGFALSAGGLALALAPQASAALPVGLAASTTQVAALFARGEGAPVSIAALTEGVLQAMFMSKVKFVASLLLVVGLLAGVTLGFALADNASVSRSLGAADKEKKEFGPSFQGRIKSTDAGKGQITLVIPIKDGGKNTEEKTFTLAKDCAIVLEDVITKTPQLPKGKLDDLTDGTSVTIQLTADSKAVARISARGPGVQGRLNAVDAATRKLTLEFKTATGPEEKQVTLIKGGKVPFNDGLSKESKDVEKSLADLTVGSSVHVQLSVDRKSALSVRPVGGSYHGSLKGIDNGNSTVTISVKEDGQVVDKTLSLMKDARLDGNLVQGVQVNVRLSVFDKTKVVQVSEVKK